MAHLRRLVGAVAVVFVSGLVFAGGAWAGVAWWHLGIGLRPSLLLSEPGAQSQEVVASADSKGFLVAELEVRGEAIACIANSASVGSCGGLGLKADVTASQLRGSLEETHAGLEEGSYCKGGLHVSGGPVGVAPLVVSCSGREVAPLEGVAVEGSASVKQTAEGGNGRLVVTASNLGDAPTSGPVVVSDALPAGLTATRVAGTAEKTGFPENGADLEVKCRIADAHDVACTFTGVLLAYERIEMVVWVTRGESVLPGEQNVVSVSGGGAREVSRSSTVFYSEEGSGEGGGLVPFGVEWGSYEQEPEEEGGLPDVQAGSHPYQLTTSLRLNEAALSPFQPAQPRNLQFDLPAGLVGDVQAVPQCSYAKFMTIIEEVKGSHGSPENLCPADTVIGVSLQGVVLGQPPNDNYYSEDVPVFNLTPARGEPARFGFEIQKIPAILNTSVRTGGDYGVRVQVRDLTQVAATVISSVVSIWGVPGDARHDRTRGWECLEMGQQPGCAPSLGSALPFLTMPSACERFQAPTQVQSWQPTATLLPPVDSVFEETLDGCNKLPFDAEIQTAPDVQSASTPTGLTVHVHVPQEAALNANGLTDADVRNIVVALPAGVSLNPGGGAGLAACSETQIGFLENEVEGPAGTLHSLFTAGRPEPFCPDASKIATVKINTPLLPNPVEGSVFLASPAPDGEPGMNPFNSLIAMYLVAEDPVSGTLIKLPGRVVPCETVGQTISGIACETPGQLISTFEDSPQLPFEDAELHFFGGGNAPLATPGLCGSYKTTGLFSSWSGAAPVTATSHFEITSGPNGSSCANPRPFAPEFQAGTTNVQAGAFSELRTTIGHPDADQQLGGLTVKLPPGLSGLLSKVKLCQEPQASQGTCGPESLIGHTIVTAGFGSSPVVVKRPGNVYITGPYKGAPYGLSIANPAEAGPFDLEKGTPCDCIVVRAKVEVDPITAQLTVTSDPLPTMIKGIPLDLQHVQVAIDRPEFTFNPTSCNKMGVQGSMQSNEGATAPVSTPFQVTDCAALGFKPSFTASTSGKTSRRFGASLHVKITYPKNSMTSQANIHSVKVELPKKLPSRLQTLHEACLYTVFNENPANCSAASRVGYAKAITPLLPVPLAGPAYFVSYGGAQFPELVIVLQGYGVTIDLHGETFINEKTSVTTSTFKTAPDQPINSFEITLPEGSHSALDANANLCGTSRILTTKHKVTVDVKGHKHTIIRKTHKRVATPLVMPTIITAQDGAIIHQNTNITVTGCKTHNKKASSHQKHK